MTKKGRMLLIFQQQCFSDQHNLFESFGRDWWIEEEGGINLIWNQLIDDSQPKFKTNKNKTLVSLRWMLAHFQVCCWCWHWLRCQRAHLCVSVGNSHPIFAPTNTALDHWHCHVWALTPFLSRKCKCNGGKWESDKPQKMEQVGHINYQSTVCIPSLAFAQLLTLLLPARECFCKC